MSENKKKFHLLTEMGGHSTPVADIIWAKPYERGEEYSRHKLGIKAESDVTARGPYSGGASQVNFEEFVRGGGLVKLPNDDLALNPNIKFRIGVWQPSQYRLYENSRGYTSYVEYEGTGVMWGGQRPIRENLKTPIETLLKILPNAAIDASEPPKDDPEREAYKIVWASTVAPWRKGLERIADQYYNGYTPRTEKELQIEAAVRRIRAGQDQRPITTEYEAARNEVFLHISSGLRSLAGVIDYLNENAFQGPKVLLDYVDAYSHRLTYKASLAGDSTHNGLAYLEHYGEVYSRLIKLFEDTARKIEAEFKESDNNIDPYLLKAIDAERKEIMERAHIVHGFYYHGEFSTPVDQSSNDYAKAEVVIKEVVAELGQVTKTGKWNPELVRVKHAVTGRDADIETPSSAEFSRIASMVPKLRQIGFLGNGD